MGWKSKDPIVGRHFIYLPYFLYDFLQLNNHLRCYWKVFKVTFNLLLPNTKVEIEKLWFIAWVYHKKIRSIKWLTIITYDKKWLKVTTNKEKKKSSSTSSYCHWGSKYLKRSEQLKLELAGIRNNRSIKYEKWIRRWLD